MKDPHHEDTMDVHPINTPERKNPVPYNTSRKRLKLPEYGRLVQQMAEIAVTIEDRNARQAYAEAIIALMANFNPQMKNVPDYHVKLWDHLAYMTDYQLDIDYPQPITPKEENNRPSRLKYPQTHIRFRHYGHLVEEAVRIMEETSDETLRNELMMLIANRMKRNLADWKGDGVEDEKVAHDLELYTQGKMKPDFQNNKLAPVSPAGFHNKHNK
ncbi:MAG TPA: DUF4290 domain-containing protein [Alloprevotella sp.]|nr:DUF4290 domain-containing protein [Alloprevotella sp.]